MVKNACWKRTSFVVNEEEFSLLVLLDAEEVEGLPEDLAELRVLLDRKLRGDAAYIRFCDIVWVLSVLTSPV